MTSPLPLGEGQGEGLRLSTDARFSGSVSRTVPTVDRAKATVTTKVKFDRLDDRILPDMSAKVSFLSKKVDANEEKASLTVPPDAVVVRDGKSLVFRVRTSGDKSSAEAVEVKTGAKSADAIEIAGGALKSGDKIVAKPSDKVVDGAVVTVQAR